MNTSHSVTGSNGITAYVDCFPDLILHRCESGVAQLISTDLHLCNCSQNLEWERFSRACVVIFSGRKKRSETYSTPIPNDCLFQGIMKVSRKDQVFCVLRTVLHMRG